MRNLFLLAILILGMSCTKDDVPSSFVFSCERANDARAQYEIDYAQWEAQIKSGNYFQTNEQMQEALYLIQAKCKDITSRSECPIPYF